MIAPLGPGCYELRRWDTGQLVLYGRGANVAFRMTSLLPAWRGGRGTRINEEKREYVAAHLRKIEYRTMACADRIRAVIRERELRRNKGKYLFGT